MLIFGFIFLANCSYLHDVGFKLHFNSLKFLWSDLQVIMLPFIQRKKKIHVSRLILFRALPKKNKKSTWHYHTDLSGNFWTDWSERRIESLHWYVQQPGILDTSRATDNTNNSRYFFIIQLLFGCDICIDYNPCKLTSFI